MKTCCLLVLVILNMAASLYTPYIASQAGGGLARLRSPYRDLPDVSTHSIVWLPDGESFLVSASGGIWRYDRDAQKPPELLVAVPELSYPVLAVNPTVTMIALGSLFYSKVLVLNYPSLELVEEIETGSEHVTNVQFSPDGTLLAIASADTSSDEMFYVNYQVQVWNLIQRTVSITLQDDIPLAPNIGFLAGERYLLVAGCTFGMDVNVSIIQLWDLETLTASAPLPTQTLSAIPFIQSKWVAVGGLNEYLVGEIRIWDIETSSMKVNFGVGESIMELALSHDLRVVATANMDRIIRLWDTDTGKEIAVLEGHTDYIDDLVFSPDDQRMISSSYDGTIRVWDVKTYTEVSTIPVPSLPS